MHVQVWAPVESVLAHELGHALVSECLGFRVSGMRWPPITSRSGVLMVDIERDLATGIVGLFEHDAAGRQKINPAYAEQGMVIACAGVVAELIYQDVATTAENVTQRMRLHENRADFDAFESGFGSDGTSEALYGAAQSAHALLKPRMKMLRTGVRYGVPFLRRILPPNGAGSTDVSWAEFQEAVASAEETEQSQ